jgi:glycosyltransferase involved in cell wall biosynthesis
VLNAEDIRISVALITRNGPERLERCLRSLRTQNVQPFEVIVSDDSSEASVAATRAIAGAYECRYIRGPQRGLYANRNFAALACRGSHIRTMDDDHAFPPGHFALCLESVHLDQEAIWTTGEIGYVNGALFERFEVANQLHPSGVGIAPENRDDNWSIADGSTIYPASVFDRGFRMVENYNYGSSYLEFGAFLYHRGYRCRCIKGAVIEHFGTAETTGRMTGYNQSQSASLIFASLAYNRYFKPHPFNCIWYLFRILVASHFDPSLVASVPQIMRSVEKRWK